MGFVLVVLLVVAGQLLAAEIAYRSLRSRDLDTALPPARLRELFEQTVAGLGWRIAEDGNRTSPRAACSPVRTSGSG